jgi:hypothetical protein
MDGMAFTECALRVVNGQVLRMLEHLTVYFNITPVEGLHIPLKDPKAESDRRRGMLRLWGNTGYKDIRGFRDSNF